MCAGGGQRSRYVLHSCPQEFQSNRKPEQEETLVPIQKSHTQGYSLSWTGLFHQWCKRTDTGWAFLLCHAVCSLQKRSAEHYLGLLRNIGEYSKHCTNVMCLPVKGLIKCCRNRGRYKTRGEGRGLRWGAWTQQERGKKERCLPETQGKDLELDVASKGFKGC